ncbi:MAG: hypothetical protein ABI042_02180 [Verrucomicrobiota bacterium]
MHRDENIIGQNVAKFRYQRSWTQDELVGKLQLLGCYMTRDILANIETQRGPVNDKQIEFFAEVFRVKEGDLFPAKRRLNGGIVGLAMQIVTRRRRSPSGRRRKQAHLAKLGKK